MDDAFFDCKKQVVTATLIAEEGQRFVGKNWIRRNPGDLCQRVAQGCLTGEGYHLCDEVCGQIGHAEAVAVEMAGRAAIGATVYLEGHTYACDDCQRVCREAGVREIVVGPPPSEEVKQ
jgi:pyrimidine deaminase RibD-like protein